MSINLIPMNGTIKPHKVKSFDAPKEPAAKKASTTKKK